MLNTTHTYEFRLVHMSKHMSPTTTLWRPGAPQPLHLDSLVINEAVTIFLSLRHGHATGSQHLVLELLVKLYDSRIGVILFSNRLVDTSELSKRLFC
jgi:hypothetical protein